MTDPKFDQYAHSYNDLHHQSTQIAGEEPDYFSAYKIAFLAEKLGEPSMSRNLLDFGCGVGNCLGHLLATFPTSNVYGLDISSASIEVARQAFPKAHLDLIQESLPLLDNSINAAIAVGVYHHMPVSERQKWTNELRRVIRPGGGLYIFEHNPLNPVTQKIVRDCPFDDDAILLPRRESLALMRDAGFTDLSCDYVMFFPKSLAGLRPLEKYIRGIPFGAQYVAYGRA